MHIHDYRIERADGDCTVSAMVGSTRIYYRLINGDCPDVLGDPFIIAGMVSAMEQGSSISFEAGIPVSNRLIENLERYQEIYARWYPHLRPVAIDAPGRVSSRPRTGKVGCFNSGGVDSLYSALRHRDEITDFVLCQGLDISLKEGDRWDKTVEQVGKVARELGKRLVLLETNAKQLTGSRTDNHAAILVSTASLLGLDTIIVPSSLEESELKMAWGSHPLTDPLLSSDWTAVVYDETAARTRKLAYIAEAKIGLDQLRVCNRHSDYNCGSCEKCLRTMVTMDILGAASAALPRFQPRMLRPIKLWNQPQYGFWQSILDLARERGRTDVAREARRLLGDYSRRAWLRNLDSRYLGGVVKRLKLRLTSRGSGPRH
ncbi:MAG TPA: hypothetical protein VNO53_04710 [Steroidobacteraceae bacterium]|nr:hypothetical protein [Steroidobacteraceae bacterium]